MASNSKIRRRRYRDNQKPKSKRASTTNEQLAAGPTSVHDVTDHVLELILLRLRSPACLVRAAAACKRWRRVIAAAGFLSHCLHAPSFVTGHYHAFDPDWVDYGSPPITGNPVFIPSPSLAVVDSRHFSLDLGGFLPDSDSGWALADSRGSLLLFFRKRTGWASLANTQYFRVIGGGEAGGALRVVRQVRNELRVLARRRGSDDADEWVRVVERLVRLREATLGLPGRNDRFFQRNAMIMAAHEAYVLVTPQEKTWLFSVELETMRAEREHKRNKYAGQAYPSQLPWPPSLMACGTCERGSRRRRSSGR